MPTAALLEIPTQTVNQPTTLAQLPMPFGAEVQPDGSVRFRLWAPDVEIVQLKLEETQQRLPLRADGTGWHELVTDAAGVGSLYRYELPDGSLVPDPASRFQPDGVHGSSQVIDPRSFDWGSGTGTAETWAGRPWPETVLYELHLGTFSPEGTCLGAIARLDHLVDLGVNAIEIMPVAAFPGTRSWGYDGALLYAPDISYGRPEDLKTLVREAHARGLSVILDVVYNHFGPDGNYLSSYFSDFFTKEHKTNWGDAINYDGRHSEIVREFIIRNALYWIEEFHFDGLRLDAVHAIVDDSETHVLTELAQRVRALAGTLATDLATDRPVHLILENDKNQASRLLRDEAGKPLYYTAQWNDDMHHVLHTAATQEDVGYYRDYQGDAHKLGRALAEGFCFQGETTSKGDARGERCEFLPPEAFIAFMQNHDQIGNRAFGERMNAIARPEAVRALVAVYLLLPQIPMLFMGEEWASSQPFPFFCDFDAELGGLVTDGRRKEFAGFPAFSDPEKLATIPDPQAESTFLSAKLDWDKLQVPEHAEWLTLYKQLLQTRKREIMPLLSRIGVRASSYQALGESAVRIGWRLDGDGELRLLANLGDQALLTEQPLTGGQAGRILWQQGQLAQTGEMPGWSVCWSIL